MQHKKLLFAAAACISIAAPALAADEHGTYQTPHLVTCEAYAKDRKEPVNTGMNAVDTIYVSGWLSAYNYLTPNTYDIIPNHNMGAVMEWLDEFCKANPKQNLEIGLLKLTDDLYPKRMQVFTPPPKAVSPADASKTPPADKKK